LKKINIDIKTNGGTKTIEAWLPNASSRLAVHLTSRREGAKKKGWTVTHIASGIAVNQKLKTKADALLLARTFANAPEWDLIGEDGDVSKFPVSIRRAILAVGENIKYGRPIVRF
jgi:hypothetical protein